MSESVLSGKLKAVKLLALDCDGVLTDNYTYVDNIGNEFSRFTHRDGMGIRMLRESGIPVIVITTQISPYVSKRCLKMKIDCFSAVENKLAVLSKVIKSMKIGLKNVCFAGDDVGDLEVMRAVGLPIAVADAIDEVKSVALHVTERKGGEHAVREICDLILKARRGKHESQGV